MVSFGVQSHSQACQTVETAYPFVLAWGSRGEGNGLCVNPGQATRNGLLWRYSGDVCWSNFHYDREGIFGHSVRLGTWRRCCYATFRMRYACTVTTVQGYPDEIGPDATVKGSLARCKSPVALSPASLAEPSPSLSGGKNSATGMPVAKYNA